MLCCETGTYLAGESCRTSIAKQALNIFRWFRAFSHAVISSCGRSLQRPEGLTVWWMKFCGSIPRMIRQKSDSEERFASRRCQMIRISLSVHVNGHRCMPDFPFYGMSAGDNAIQKRDKINRLYLFKCLFLNEYAI